MTDQILAKPVYFLFQEKMKYDDTNLSPWLKSLANFAALALKKYQVEFAGLLQYICNQLKAEKR